MEFHGFLIFGFEVDQRFAALGLVEVDSLSDVEVKLLSRRNADVEAIALDRIEDLLRVLVEHGTRALERGILRSGKRDLLRRASQRAAHVLGLLKAGRGSGQKGRGEQLDFGPIVRLEDVTLQAS